MKLEHFVVTRFSYRGREAFKKIGGPTWYSTLDPLAPLNLEFRFKLFEITSLPSMLSQIDQNFTWVIIVDRDLPSDFRSRLERLVSGRKRTFLHTYDPEVALYSIDWLEPYFHHTDPDFVLTTNFDDDDCISRHYVKGLQQQIQQAHDQGELPLIKIFACMDFLEWDLVISKEAPLGWKSPWHRGKWPSNLGFSLLCGYPEYSFTCLALNHRQGRNYFDWQHKPADAHVEFIRKTVLRVSDHNEDHLERWPKELMFFDLSQAVGPPIVLNHLFNDQIMRVFEAKSKRTKVEGESTFPDMAINWDAIAKHSRSFQKTWKAYTQVLQRQWAAIQLSKPSPGWIDRGRAWAKGTKAFFRL